MAIIAIIIVNEISMSQMQRSGAAVIRGTTVEANLVARAFKTVTTMEMLEVASMDEITGLLSAIGTKIIAEATS